MNLGEDVGLVPDQSDKFAEGPGIAVKPAGRASDDRWAVSVRPIAATHLVVRIEHHGDAARRERGIDRAPDLHGEPLLRLLVARESIDQASECTRGDGVPSRKDGGVDAPGEQELAVLGPRTKIDVAHQEELARFGRVTLCAENTNRIKTGAVQRAEDIGF